MASDPLPSVNRCYEPLQHEWVATDDSLVVTMTFPVGSEWFSGHFPGFPILPGVAQLFFLRRFARKVFADFPEGAVYRRIKFRRLVRPGECVRLEIVRRGEHGFAFAFSVEGEVASSGSIESRDGDVPKVGCACGLAHAGEDKPLPPSTLLELLPHRPPMVLLSEALSVEVPGEAVAVADTSPRCLFYDSQLDGVPACVALEYMAQTMALAVGAERRRSGQVPKVGFVLGTRRLDVKVASFAGAMRYVTAAKCVYADDEFASFDCSIAAPDGEMMAVASLTAFQPPGDPVAFAEKMRTLDER